MAANQTLPKVYLHKEDESGKCDCSAPGVDAATGLVKIDPKMQVENDILKIDLFDFGAMPKLGNASDIAAVRVHVRGKQVMVFAIYNDPMKTATMECCTGSGCTCYSSGCYC